MRMTTIEAIEARHSVRAFLDKPIRPEIQQRLNGFAQDCNQASGLHIQIRYDHPEGFDARLAHYGHFRNVRNYIILSGKKTADFDFLCGYYGEQIVLLAQQLGLNTCWTALTFNRKSVKHLIPSGETLCMVIALGYGENQGVPRKSRTPQDVSDGSLDVPWFRQGVEAALKAPTAMNQQHFRFSMKDGSPWIRVSGFGAYTRVDLGIAACHFEAASGHRLLH